MTRILVINSGSSSLKYQLIDAQTEERLVHGIIDRIGEVESFLSHSAGDLVREQHRHVADHAVAFEAMIELFEEAGLGLLDAGLIAVGHRVVHGGDRFFAPTLIDDEVAATIAELSVLAPLHNPANLAGIEAARAAFSNLPHVAVFDTAFHQSMPQSAYTYAIKADLAQQHGVRRYGFHGTSHESTSRRAAAFLNRPVDSLNQVVLHLGNGASMTAVEQGRSRDTSMGMTPLAGLVMGSRSGDIDPSIVFHLNREANLSIDELDHLLNKDSGVLGLSGHRDMRDVRAAAAQGDAQAQLALDVYVHRVRHYLGAYLLQLGGADVIVFTGGVGEHDAATRAAVLADLDWLGIQLDPALNVPVASDMAAATSGEIRLISAPTSKVAVLVVSANEELEIARQAAELVAR